MKNTTHKEKQKKPENETKVEAFTRVVNPKTVRAIATIRQIARCVGSKYYDITEEQINNLISGLQKEVSDMEVRYQARNKTISKEEIKGLL